MSTEPYDIAPEVTDAATDMAWRILVQEVANESSAGYVETENTLDGLAAVLAKLRPQEAFGLCGNIVQRGHDL